MFRRAQAVPADVLHVYRQIVDLHRKHGDAYGIPLDIDSVLNTIMRVIRDGICLVGPTSCAGMLILPFPFNADARIAQVLFWNFKHAREMRILREILSTAKELGATHRCVASHFPNNNAGRLYRSLGLREAEIQFIGVV